MGSACLEQRWQSCGSTVPTQCRGHVAYGSNSEELSRSNCLPGYTQKRTSPDTVGMSQKCQQATSITYGNSVSGDCKLKESPPRLAHGRPQPPTMCFDDRAADREAHSHAVGLRRVEGFKEMRQALRAQPIAGIPHRDAHALRLDNSRC
jgi:hypothetical protein